MKVTYPVHFEVRKEMGEARLWKVGDTAYVFLPRVVSLGQYQSLSYRLVAVPLSVPQVDPHWTDADFPPTDPKQPDRELGWFVSRVGSKRFSAPRLAAFTGPKGILTELARNRADVNDFSQDKEEGLIQKLRREQLRFFNDTLDNLNSSLYEPLGYASKKLPAQVVELSRKFRGQDAVPKGASRNQLMLLNRCLIDGVGDDGFFPPDGERLFRWQNSADPEALVGLRKTSTFPLTPILSIQMVHDGPWAQYKLRALRSEETASLKSFDPRSINRGARAWFPQNATDDEIQPYAVLEGAGKQYVLSNKGYWIGDGLAASTRRRVGSSWIKSLKEGDRFVAEMPDNAVRKAEFGSLEIKRFEITVGKFDQVNNVPLRIRFEGVWTYVNGKKYSLVNENEVGFEPGEYRWETYGSAPSATIDSETATCWFETRMVEKKTYRRVRGTNGYSVIPARWEGGFYMKLRVAGRLTEEGLEVNLFDVANPTPLDFGALKFRAVR